MEVGHQPPAHRCHRYPGADRERFIGAVRRTGKMLLDLLPA
jgi:hypothetical protein